MVSDGSSTFVAAICLWQRACRSGTDSAISTPMLTRLSTGFALCLLVACGGRPRPPDPQLTWVPCAGKACGESCRSCAPDAYDCAETAELTYCRVDGGCFGGPPACGASAMCSLGQGCEADGGQGFCDSVGTCITSCRAADCVPAESNCHRGSTPCIGVVPCAYTGQNLPDGTACADGGFTCAGGLCIRP